MSPHTPPPPGQSEALAHGLCDFVVWTAPGFLVEAANRWRWEWKAAFGTIYPPGVFIMGVYLAVAAVVLVAAVGIRWALRSTPTE